MKDRVAKKMAEMLRTDTDHIVPSIEKLKKEIKKQKYEIKEIEERILV